MKTKFNRTLAVLTAVLMLICMLPAGIFAEGDIPIDAEHFPDANFRTYISENCDTDGSGALSPAEIAAATAFYLSGKCINDLTGIGYFTALKTLCCTGSKLTQLDVSKNTALEDLDCGDNQLTQLDVSKNTALKTLHCNYNQLLTTLNVNGAAALESLYCNDNQLTQLDVSNNTALELLDCSANRLTSLDLSANTALSTFYRSKNRYVVLSNPFNLTELPGDFDISKASDWQGGSVSGNILTFNPDKSKVTYTYDCGNGYSAEFKLILSAIVEDIPIDEEHFPDELFREYLLTYNDYETGVKFDTDSNGVLSPVEITLVTGIGIPRFTDLTGIGYFAELRYLGCCYGDMAALDVSKNTELEELYCFGNQLTQLDVSKNTALWKLECSENRLTELDLSKNTALYHLDCDNNQLTELDVSKNTALDWLMCYKNKLTQLDLSANTVLKHLDCSSNRLTSIDVSANPKLQTFYCNSNRYEVPSSPFNLTELPGNFDITKASNWQGGTVDGNILTFNPDETEVTYTYDCGNGRSAEFKLVLSEPGDYDGDGEVTTQDAIMTLRSALGLVPGEVPTAADINGDGVVNMLDAIMILRKAMGLI